MITYTYDAHNDRISSMVMFMLVLIISVIWCDQAMAAGSGSAALQPLEGPMCKVLNVMTGGVGKTVGSLALGGTAVGGLFGKVSPSTVVVTSLSLGGMLGAPQVADFLGSFTGGSGPVCSGS